MMLVCDCGSTKADWVLVDDRGGQSHYQTKGFNPYLQDAEWIYQQVHSVFDTLLNNNAVKKIYFFGSGCSDVIRKTIVKEALSKVFPVASIDIEHDLLGAAKSLLGNQTGIACILGTGSNTCLYDGNKIVDNIMSLGYILGDEGSGSHLGKLLIKSYLYREMPSDLEHLFEDKFGQDKRAFVNRIYGQQPNVYLASFTTFYVDNKNHPFLKLLLYSAFNELIERHILKYELAGSLNINFVGSIASIFKEEIKECLQQHGLHSGIFISRPIDNLVTYHIERY